MRGYYSRTDRTAWGSSGVRAGGIRMSMMTRSGLRLRLAPRRSSHEPSPTAKPWLPTAAPQVDGETKCEPD
jgi:hypothetical protein